MNNKQSMGGNPTFARIIAGGGGSAPLVLPVSFVGNYFTFTVAADGSLRIDQNVIDVPVSAENHWARRITRRIDTPWQGQLNENVLQIDTGNTEGAMFDSYWTQTGTAGALRKYMVERWQLQNNPNHDEWYDPQRPGGGFLSTWNLSMYYIDAALHENIFRLNSDGALLQRLIPPAGAGAIAIAASYADLFSASNPTDGSAVGWWANKYGRMNFFQDAYNSGSGHANAHWDLWLISQADSGINKLALQVMPRNSAVLSTTDAAALSYNTTTDKLGMSLNGGALSPLVTEGSLIAAIPSGSIVNAKLADMATATVKGRNTAGTGVPEDVTMAQLAALLGFTGGAWDLVAVAGAAAQNLASALALSATDQDIEFEFKIVGPNATNVYSVEPNNLATNQSFQRTGVDNGGNAFTDTKTIFEIGDISTTAALYGHGRITQMTGIERMINITSWQTGADGTFMYINQGRWNVTSAVTGVRLHASTATGLGIGTTLRTRKV